MGTACINHYEYIGFAVFPIQLGLWTLELSHDAQICQRTSKITIGKCKNTKIRILLLKMSERLILFYILANTNDLIKLKLMFVKYGIISD